MRKIEVDYDIRLQRVEDNIAQDKQDAGRYRAALEEFSDLLAQDPFNCVVYRHRGHRYLSLSQFSQAAADLELACRLDPYYWKSWYYLGMIRYYQGEWEDALYYFGQSLHYIGEDVVYTPAITNWIYICNCHLGRKGSADAEALLEPFTKTGDEGNKVYSNLLLLHKGEIGAEVIEGKLNSGQLSDVAQISIGFGLALYHYFDGARERARALCNRILEEGKSWHALAYIACKFDVERLFN